MGEKVSIGISARHVHLSKEDLEKLFGPGHELTAEKPLSQPGQFSCAETVAVFGPRGSLPKIRVLGPVRKQTQVEISRSDAFTLGLVPPVRDSGSLAGSPGARLVGPAGEIVLSEGVILAQRHLHLHTTDAQRLDLKDQDYIKIRVAGQRGVIFERVLVRVHDNYALDFHLDTDEANAAGVNNGELAELVD